MGSAEPHKAVLCSLFSLSTQLHPQNFFSVCIAVDSEVFGRACSHKVMIKVFQIAYTQNVHLKYIHHEQGTELWETLTLSAMKPNGTCLLFFAFARLEQEIVDILPKRNFLFRLICMRETLLTRASTFFQVICVFILLSSLES